MPLAKASLLVVALAALRGYSNPVPQEDVKGGVHIMPPGPSVINDKLAEHLKKDKWDTSDVEVMCAWEESDDLDDPENRAHAWTASGADTLLDDFVKKHIDGKGNGKPEGWFDEFQRDLFGNPEEMHCSSLSDDCTKPFTCREMFDMEKVVEWWVLLAVEKMFNVFAKLHEELVQGSTIDHMLDIPSIVKEFKQPKKEPRDVPLHTALLLLSTALGGSAQAIAKAGPQATVVNTIAVAMFGGIGIGNPMGTGEEPEDTYEGDAADALSSSVQEAYNELKDKTEGIAKAAVGYAKVGRLPDRALTGDYQTEVAQYFDGGRWLIDSNDQAIDNYIDSAKVYMKQALAIEALTIQDIEIYIWEGITKDECYELQTLKYPYDSATWMTEDDGVSEHGCWLFMMRRRVEGGPPQAMHIFGDDNDIDYTDKQRLPQTLEKDDFTKLKTEYKIGSGLPMEDKMRPLYKNAFDCQKEGSDTTDDPEIVMDRSNNKPPRCLFNMPVRRVKWRHGNKIHLDGVFTSEDHWGGPEKITG